MSGDWDLAAAAAAPAVEPPAPQLLDVDGPETAVARYEAAASVAQVPPPSKRGRPAWRLQEVLRGAGGGAVDE
eukprot:7191056-Pyramimonas_sp.AAC.1